jgi:hypothetical protein
MFNALMQSAGLAAKNTAIGFLGTILAVVGIGFLTAALWIGLSHTYGPMVAATSIGSLYIIIGIVVLYTLHLHGGHKVPVVAPPPQVAALTPMQSVIVAFMQGLDAASIAKGRGGLG